MKHVVRPMTELGALEDEFIAAHARLVNEIRLAAKKSFFAQVIDLVRAGRSGTDICRAAKACDDARKELEAKRAALIAGFVHPVEGEPFITNATLRDILGRKSLAPAN